MGKNNEKDYRRATQTVELTAEAMDCNPISLLDRLKQKKSAILRESNARVKNLDLEIRSLEMTDAENVVKNAEAALYND